MKQKAQKLEQVKYWTEVCKSVQTVVRQAWTKLNAKHSDITHVFQNLCELVVKTDMHYT